MSGLKARSRAALAAHFEGVPREVKLLPDGRRRSSAVYSVVADELPVVERAPASRLAIRAT